MNSKKVIVNYLYNLTYQLLQIILPIVTTPYISRVLGVEGVGTYTVTYAITNYFILFGMVGISTYGCRQIAYVRDDKKLMSQVFWDITSLKVITMGISILVFYSYAIFFATLEERVLYCVQGIVLLAQIFDISWYFAGRESFKKTAVRNMIVKIASVSAVFLFVKSKNDIILYAFIIAFSTLIGQVILWKGIAKEIVFLKPNKTTLIKHLKGTMPLWIPSIAINIYNSVDKVMLSYLVDNISVGLYESSQKVVKVAATVTTSLSTVVAPSIANNYKNGRTEETKRIGTNTLIFISMISIPICFGMISVRETLVPWFYGSGYEGVSNLLLLSAWLVITLGWSSIFGTQILVSCGEEKKYTLAIFVSLIINLLLNLLLIPKIAESGAIIASVSAEYVGMFIMMYFCKNRLDLKSVIKPVSKFLVSSIIMCICIFYLGRLIDTKFIATFIQVLLGGILYIVLLLVFRESYVMSAITKIKSKLEKR